MWGTTKLPLWQIIAVWAQNRRFGCKIATYSSSPVIWTIAKKTIRDWTCFCVWHQFQTATLSNLYCSTSRGKKVDLLLSEDTVQRYLICGGFSGSITLKSAPLQSAFCNVDIDDHIVGRLGHALIYPNPKRNSNLTRCVTCNFNSSPFLDTLQFSGSHVYQNWNFEPFLAPNGPLKHWICTYPKHKPKLILSILKI